MLTQKGVVIPQLSSGLGNRLFQYAAAAGLAEHLGRTVVFHTGALTECPHGPIATLFRLFPRVPVVTDAPIISADTLRLSETREQLYEHLPWPDAAAVADRTVLLGGFRQNPAYFPAGSSGGGSVASLQPDWENALGGAAVCNWLNIDSGLPTVEECRRTVALHVRLGDYKNLPHHQVDLGAYYVRALQLAPAGSRIHLFSDEPDICRGFIARLLAALPGKRFQFTVARRRADVESLYEMSRCLGGTITANSTFSWWGAWFARENGAPWASFPDRMGDGLPASAGMIPHWGIVLPTADQ